MPSKKELRKRGSKIFVIATDQISTLRNVFKYIKKITSQCCITVTASGIKLMKLSNDKTILIKLLLYAAQFDIFICDTTISIGLSITDFYKTLKQFDDHNHIEIYMNKHNHDTLYLHNLTKDHNTFIHTLDLTETNIPIPVTKFKHVIEIESSIFYKICNNPNNKELISINNKIMKLSDTLNNLSKKYINNEDIQTINNDIMCASIVFQTFVKDTNIDDTDTNSHIVKMKSSKNNFSLMDQKIEHKHVTVSDTVIKGKYQLRHLSNLCLCVDLCNTFTIYLKNDFPLVAKISVGTLGILYVFITQVIP